MALTILNELWTNGYQKIMDNPEHKAFHDEAVGMASEEFRKLPYEELRKREFLFIPNDEYMALMFGHEIMDPVYGLYKGEYCTMLHRIIFPIRGFNNQVVAIGGWTDESEYKYVYSPSSLWSKERYLYIQPEEFKQALIDGYLIIVDGVFDAISLNHLGLHAGSLMGSKLSNWHQQYFKLIKHIVVIPDNDNAGLVLARKIKRVRSDALIIWQDKFKDIDDYIKGADTSTLLKTFNNLEVMSMLGKKFI